jgi:hypothetical protein
MPLHSVCTTLLHEYLYHTLSLLHRPIMCPRPGRIRNTIFTTWVSLLHRPTTFKSVFMCPRPTIFTTWLFIRPTVFTTCVSLLHMPTTLKSVFLTPCLCTCNSIRKVSKVSSKVGTDILEKQRLLNVNAGMLVLPLNIYIWINNNNNKMNAGMLVLPLCIYIWIIGNYRSVGKRSSRVPEPSRRYVSKVRKVGKLIKLGKGK